MHPSVCALLVVLCNRYVITLQVGRSSQPHLACNNKLLKVDEFDRTWTSGVLIHPSALVTTSQQFYNTFQIAATCHFRRVLSRKQASCEHFTSRAAARLMHSMHHACTAVVPNRLAGTSGQGMHW